MYEFVELGKTLLDIGIGTGLSSALFHKTGLNISGFDNSAQMLEGCKSKTFSGEIIQHNFLNVPYPYKADSFNHVISLAVLNFLTDLTPVIKGVARITKPKEIFGFTIEEKKLNQKAQYTMTIASGNDRTHGQSRIAMYRHTDKYIRELLASVGFSACKSLEFLADRYPEQEIEVYFKADIAQKKMRPTPAPPDPSIHSGQAPALPLV